ncbi:MAG: glycerophosphodiester phosphodiesterase, partial [Raoultibacter sp.]
AFIILIAVFCIHAFFLSFGIHFFTLCRQPWMKARRSSKHLLERNKWLLLRRLLAVNGIVIALTLAISLLGGLGISVLLESASSLPVLIIWGFALLVFVAIASCIFLPLSYAALSTTFYELAAKRGIVITYDFTEHAPSRRRRAGRVVVGVGVCILALFSLAAYTQIHGTFEPNPGPPETFEITAHRGGSRNAPENTLAAFQQAIDEGADWVELDVQQTSDGVLMVMHDANLKRTTGLDKEFWQVTYDEIKNLDNGSWFAPAFAQERVCTLEEALALCKDKIKMSIEVKPDGHGVDLEEKTVALINEYDMKDQVVVASITYDSLVRVKNADPSMRTMYDMTLAYGLISEIEYVDYFSVDDFFVTQELVNNVRDAGKIIYAWTVNDPTNIARLIEYGVDGLVTDDVKLAREIATAAETQDSQLID